MMNISNSVIIQHKSGSNTCSASGFFLPGTKHVITCATWLYQYPPVSKKFVVFLELENRTTIKQDAILSDIVPLWSLEASLQNLQQDVSFTEGVGHGVLSKLCSIIQLEVTGPPLQCRDCDLFKRTPVAVGRDVYARGTPFGDHEPALFINSVLVGCVCGVYGDGELFTTDCRVTPGCEGAPVYCRSTDSLIGLVLSPIFTKSGHPTGLSLCCGVNTMTNVLKRHINGREITNLPVLEKSSPVCGVVSVHTSRGVWGSGIVMQDDVIITCAHVIHNETGPITIGRTGPQCRVLYCAGPGQVPDLAVLKMTTPHHHKHTQPLVTNLSDSYRVGDDVAIISYGLVRPRDDDDGPVVTKGAISKVICHNGTPVMIQTNAVVSAGSSGGVVSLSTGCPIGIVVSYAKDDASNLIYPRLNFCIPLTWIWQAVQNFLLHKDPVVFTALCDRQPEINSLWKLDKLQPHVKSRL